MQGQGGRRQKQCLIGLRVCGLVFVERAYMIVPRIIVGLNHGLGAWGCRAGLQGKCFQLATWMVAGERLCFAGEVRGEHAHSLDSIKANNFTLSASQISCQETVRDVTQSERRVHWAARVPRFPFVSPFRSSLQSQSGRSTAGAVFAVQESKMANMVIGAAAVSRGPAA